MAKEKVILNLDIETLNFIQAVVELSKVSRDDVIAVILSMELIKEKINGKKEKNKKNKKK